MGSVKEIWVHLKPRGGICWVLSSEHLWLYLCFHDISRDNDMEKDWKRTRVEVAVGHDCGPHKGRWLSWLGLEPWQWDAEMWIFWQVINCRSNEPWWLIMCEWWVSSLRKKEILIKFMAWEIGGRQCSLANSTELLMDFNENEFHFLLWH